MWKEEEIAGYLKSNVDKALRANDNMLDSVGGHLKLPPAVLETWHSNVFRRSLKSGKRIPILLVDSEDMVDGANSGLTIPPGHGTPS